jgi:hypothetical protein
MIIIIKNTRNHHLLNQTQEISYNAVLFLYHSMRNFILHNLCWYMFSVTTVF